MNITGNRRSVSTGKEIHITVRKTSTTDSRQIQRKTRKGWRHTSYRIKWKEEKEEELKTTKERKNQGTRDATGIKRREEIFSLKTKEQEKKEERRWWRRTSLRIKDWRRRLWEWDKEWDERIEGRRERDTKEKRRETQEFKLQEKASIPLWQKEGKREKRMKKKGEQRE